MKYLQQTKLFNSQKHNLRKDEMKLTIPLHKAHLKTTTAGPFQLFFFLFKPNTVFMKDFATLEGKILYLSILLSLIALTVTFKVCSCCLFNVL